MLYEHDVKLQSKSLSSHISASVLVFAKCTSSSAWQFCLLTLAVSSYALRGTAAADQRDAEIRDWWQGHQDRDYVAVFDSPSHCLW